MDTKMTSYIMPTEIIDSDHPHVRQRAEAIIANSKNTREKAINLFYFVRDEIKYNIYVQRSRAEHFLASRTLASGEGYCVQKAVLLAALSRAVGIPSAMGFARLRNHLMPEKLFRLLGSNILAFHGYTQLYLDDKWIKATPAFDLGLCRKNGIIAVEFDGFHDAMLHPRNKAGQLHIEYVRHLGDLYPDLPLETLKENLIRAYGKTSVV